jgi:hypothetical protein
MSEQNHAATRQEILTKMGTGSSVKISELTNDPSLFITHFGRREDLDYVLVMEGEQINKIL